jgi:carboxymethylenebutenolidase
MTDWFTLDAADGPMNVYVARPAAPADRAAIVLQEAFGVNAHIQEVARRFAERGFLALAPDLFHRTGVAELPYERHAEAVGLIGGIDAEQITTDVQACLDHLAGEGIAVERTAITGFCFGGRAAFTAATAVPGLGAAAVFYGPGIAAGPHAVLERAADITAPLLLHVGADDPTIPTEQVTAIDTALAAAGARFTQHVYPGAGHAFACDARPHLFRPLQARQAWERTWDFLDVHLAESA